MCKTKMAVDAAQPNLPQRRRTPSATPIQSSSKIQNPRSQPQLDTSTSNVTTGSYSSGGGTGSSYRLDSSTATAEASTSSRTSLTILRESLPENTHIYDFSEIRFATNNFLAKRFSSSSSSSPSWRCSLRGKEVIVFQRKFRRSKPTSSELREKLSVICRSHHMSIIKLLGASISGEYIYLVYDFMHGGNLEDCLRNRRNPDFTVLSTWMSRMQVATDLAAGLDYIHNNTGLDINLVHKYVKASSVIVTEPSFNAKICHFGTAELCGEVVIEPKVLKKEKSGGEITDVISPESSPLKELLKRSDSRAMQFEGIKGYMPPEFRGLATQKSDVYAFGVVVLELLSGEEPLKYKYDKKSGNHVKISVVDTARQALEEDGGGEVDGRLRRWVDRRLNDSFPVEVAERLTRIALDCVVEDANKRPNMSRVAGKISKLYLDSRKWADTLRVPTEITASFAPR